MEMKIWQIIVDMAKRYWSLATAPEDSDDEAYHW